MIAAGWTPFCHLLSSAAVYEEAMDETQASKALRLAIKSVMQ